MTKKRQALVTGASAMVAGIVGSIASLAFSKKLAHHDKVSSTDIPPHFLGSWHFHDATTGFDHSLKIKSDLTFHLDDILLHGRIDSYSNTELIFIDHYGYQLIVHADSKNPVSFYDEADDRTYLFNFEE